mmetsp:Transcript_18229/g.22741  ORF Transcript_18229/g.22741 Transcript_18229/m.22741 type:complete len:135 (-) Transcript_18229:1059-1463(-)|eukprot:CAMPEP_0170470154 /NCGR_PEP_ID=MMETSP0123-20130129/12708_1 /TAXON_ID=182087 /ORGANISM="Favella ehrenbergii, Strain Fehren 1" /LENGTH=134 /DNA_ID=CAMNT_0010737187 /DNA_START=577 /DNA_END=981 /DNA_ORIENTATION=-
MDFMLTGESYAGHYIPAFSNALLDDDAFSGIFKASLMGDPYTAGLTQKRLMYKVPEALNILDDSNMPQIAALNKNCVESVSYDECNKIMNYIEDVSGGAFSYDQRIFGVDWDPEEAIVTNYFSGQDDTTSKTIQ